LKKDVVDKKRRKEVNGFAPPLRRRVLTERNDKKNKTLREDLPVQHYSGRESEKARPEYGDPVRKGLGGSKKPKEGSNSEKKKKDQIGVV